MSGPVLARVRGVVPEVGRQVAERRLRQRCRRLGVLALTYDDGPGRRLTPQVLDVLGEYEAKATFFALGRHAASAADVLDRIIAEGHEVGCHGHDHVNHLRVPRADALADIEHGYRTLAPWIGERGVYRPPHGNRSLATQRSLRRRKVPVGWWTVDSGDARLAAPDADAVLRRVEAARGGVVLMHDFDRGEGIHRDREEFVLALTTSLLQLARRRRWTIAPVGTLL